MSVFRMPDGKVVDTDKAQAKWDEARNWNGRNHISRATGVQWTHETLYRSAKGRYYIVLDSQWQGCLPTARWVDAEQATRWLLLMEEVLPAHLASREASLVE